MMSVIMTDDAVTRPEAAEPTAELAAEPTAELAVTQHAAAVQQAVQPTTHQEGSGTARTWDPSTTETDNRECLFIVFIIAILFWRREHCSLYYFPHQISTRLQAHTLYFPHVFVTHLIIEFYVMFVLNTWAPRAWPES